MDRNKFLHRLQVSLLMTLLTAGVVSLATLLIEHSDQNILRFFEYCAFGTLMAYASGFPMIHTRRHNTRR